MFLVSFVLALFLSHHCLVKNYIMFLVPFVLALLEPLLSFCMSSISFLLFHAIVGKEGNELGANSVNVLISND